MRILRWCTLVLLLLIVIGWSAAWFLGRQLILGQIQDEVFNSAADGTRTLALENATLTTQGLRFGGFPFHYRLRLNEGKLLTSQLGAPLDLPDQAQVSVSLAGSLWGALTGQSVGARLVLDGTYALSPNDTLSINRGWVRLGISNISLTDPGSAWVFDGVDMDLSQVSLTLSGNEVASMGRLHLDMDRQGTTSGYNYDLSIANMGTALPIFTQIPSQVDSLQLTGRIQPDIRAAYVNLALNLANNPFEALLASQESLGLLISSEPGLYIDAGSIEMGAARLSGRLHMPLNILVRRQRAVVGLNGTFAGEGMTPLLRAAMQEPLLQATEIPLLIGPMLAASARYGVDLDGGRPSTLSGTLAEIGPRGVRLLPEPLVLNGQEIGL